MNRLQHKVALITGAASGIGKAVTKRFLQEGATVVMNDVNAGGQELCDAYSKEGYNVDFVQLDLGETSLLPTLIQFVKEKHGKLDILVNNAGMYFPRTVFTMTEADWSRLLKVNMDSVFFLSREAALLMMEHGYGRIVNVASLQGYRASVESAHYCASKGAIIQLTRCFALELAESGILVNAVAPGVIRTGMTVMDGVDETETELFQEVYIKHKKIPLLREGGADEVAASILFLASEDCQYVTGQVLGVDGGLSVVW